VKGAITFNPSSTGSVATTTTPSGRASWKGELATQVVGRINSVNGIALPIAEKFQR
jgi:hypothetical protein